MSTPFYERGGVVIYLGDCREVLPTLARKSCDLLLTDPPYRVAYSGQSSMRKSGAFGPIVGDDDASFVPGTLSLACRALRDNRHAYVFGPPELLPVEFAAAAELIWDKSIMGVQNLSLPWGPAHERINFAVYRPSAANRKAGQGRLAARLRQGSVLHFKRPNSRGVSRHPTEKPVPLLRCLVESSSHYGERVLDPFMGVGSTLVAAVLECRVGTGIEIEERYAEVAARRVDAALDYIAAWKDAA